MHTHFKVNGFRFVSGFVADTRAFSYGFMDPLRLKASFFDIYEVHIMNRTTLKSHVNVSAVVLCVDYVWHFLPANHDIYYVQRAMEN